MKFDDIVYLFQIGSSAAAIAAGNPLAASLANGAARLLKIAHDAYVSGRERGEWTPDQQKHFDEVVLPQITSQTWWKPMSQAEAEARGVA